MVTHTTPHNQYAQPFTKKYLEPTSIYTIADVHTVALNKHHHASNAHHTHEEATDENEAQKPKECLAMDRLIVALSCDLLIAAQVKAATVTHAMAPEVQSLLATSYAVLVNPHS